MLQKNAPTKVYGYLVGIEIDESVTNPEAVGMKLADSVKFMEGTGDISIDLMGQVEFVERTGEGTGEDLWDALSTDKKEMN